MIVIVCLVVNGVLLVIFLSTEILVFGAPRE